MRKTTAKSTIANIIKKHIYDNIREYAIVSILFLIGLILGVIFINNANETQITQITEYLNNFSNSLKTNYNMELIKNSIKDNVILTIIMWFAGSTIIGLPIVFGIVSFRGFCMGYTISSAVATFGIGKGAIFATCSLLMQNIIFIPALLALAVTGIKVYKSIIKDNIKFEIIRHTLFSVIILILLVISAVVETYISPNLLKMVINYI